MAYSLLQSQRRAMLLYLLWNKHIEKYADIRYNIYAIAMEAARLHTRKVPYSYYIYIWLRTCCACVDIRVK